MTWIHLHVQVLQNILMVRGHDSLLIGLVNGENLMVFELLLFHAFQAWWSSCEGSERNNYATKHVQVRRLKSSPRTIIHSP